jgi:nitrate reductase gamma subunit
MYAVLGAVIVLGIWNTIAGSWLQFGGQYNYRDGVSPWFRSIFEFQSQGRRSWRRRRWASKIHALACLPALCDVAVHPARPRLLRADRLPHPALHRLPLA